MLARSFATLTALAACLLAAAPAHAEPDIPEPETRLVLPGGAPVGGAYRIGLEIVLPEGWHTYWVNPGEAGVPPAFSTEGSGNVAGLAPSFPAPERWSDGFSASVVYHGRVVFPLAVTPADPAAPVDLRLAVDFGYCREICVPIRRELSARLSPGDPADPAAAAAVAGAEARVPVPEAKAPPGAPRLVGLERVGDDRRTAVLRIAVEAADPAAVDLFAEPPEGWYLAVPRRTGVEGGRALFELPLKGAPKRATFPGARFRFTVTGPGGAIAAERTLD